MTYEYRLFAEYAELEENRDRLAAQAESASDITRPLFESGVEQADARLSALRSDPEFTAKVTALYGPIHKALEELQGLESVVEAGLIPAEQVAQTRQSLEDRIAASPDLKLAKSLYAAATVVEVIIEKSPELEEELATAPALEEAEPVTSEEGEQERIPLVIQFKGDAVQIGKQGRFVKTSATNPSSHRDYARIRTRLLETLADHSGEEVRAGKLWEEAFPGTPLDRDVMTQVRSWFEKLTHRRKPIVVFNGKRGLGAAYSIPDFDITIVKSPVRRPAPEKSTTPKKTKSAGAKTVELRPAPSEEDSYGFPLTGHESLVVAQFLHSWRGYAEQELGLQPIPEEVVEQLQKFQSYSDRDQLIRDFTTIENARLTMLQKLSNFFENEDAVLDSLDKMPEDHDLYPLFEYMFSLEGEDRWELLAKLVEADKGVLRYTVDGSKFGSNIVTGALLMPVGLMEENSKPYSLGEPELSVEEALSDTETDTLTPEFSSPEPTDEPAIENDGFDDDATMEIQRVEAEEDEPATMAPAGTPTPDGLVPGMGEESDKSRDAWETDFRRDIGEAINVLSEDKVLVENGLAAKTISFTARSSKLGTEESLRRLHSAGLLKRMPRYNPADFLIGPELLIASYLLNNHRDELGGQNKKKQKRAQQLIKESVSAYFKKQRRTH